MLGILPLQHCRSYEWLTVIISDFNHGHGCTQHHPSLTSWYGQLSSELLKTFKYIVISDRYHHYFRHLHRWKGHCLWCCNVVLSSCTRKTSKIDVQRDSSQALTNCLFYQLRSHGMHVKTDYSPVAEPSTVLKFTLTVWDVYSLFTIVMLAKGSDSETV